MARDSKFVQVACGFDGASDAYLSLPNGTARGALVVVQEIFGVTQAMRDIADDLADNGYVALVPDLFWRLERRAELGNGDDAPLRQRAVALLNAFDVETGVRDLCAAVEHLKFLRNSPSVGIMGFCIGGRMSTLVASTGAVKCAASFYGVGLDKYLERVRAIRVPFQFHVGDKDAHIPAATIEAIKSNVEAANLSDSGVYVYPDSPHAFFNKHRTDCFNEAAYSAAKTRLLEFAGRHLN